MNVSQTNFFLLQNGFFLVKFQLENHDRKRIASRLGEQRVDLFNILLKTLPGISITYQVKYFHWNFYIEIFGIIST